MRQNGALCDNGLKPRPLNVYRCFMEHENFPWSINKRLLKEYIGVSPVYHGIPTFYILSPFLKSTFVVTKIKPGFCNKILEEYDEKEILLQKAVFITKVVVTTLTTKSTLPPLGINDNTTIMFYIQYTAEHP